MNFEAVIKLLVEKFSHQHIRYALIGGFALHAAGYSRATRDIDFLVHKDDMPKVKSILLDIGYDAVHESVDAANFWGRLKELGGVDFIIAHRKYALGMLGRAKDYEVLPGYIMKVVMIEDLIGLKLQAAANDPQRASQDMADIEWLIRHHRQKLDVTIVREYFNLFGKESLLDQLLKEGGHA